MSATATAPSTKSAATPAAELLSGDCDVRTAMGYVAAGRITMDEYLAWDAARLAAVQSTVAKGAAERPKKGPPAAFTRAMFASKAEDVAVTIDGTPMVATVKEFSSGSLGWYLNGKARLKVGEVWVEVQVGCNLTIVGSKELPQG